MGQLGKIQTNFVRGLNQQASQTIDQNECSVAENYLFKDRSATVREGFSVFGSLPAPVVALTKFYNKDGGNYFCAIAGGTFYNSVTSGSFTSVSIGGSISGIVDTEVYAGALYFTDYSTPVKYFDGIIVDIAGLSSPVFRKQIEDFENVGQWTYSTNGYLQADTKYTHIDRGNQAILFSASSPSTAAIFQAGGKNNELLTTIATSANTPINVLNTTLTRDLSGNYHIVWAEIGTENAQYAASLNNGSTWTKTNLSMPLSVPLGLATDSSNNLHAAIFQKTSTTMGGTLWYKQYHNYSGWTNISSVYSVSNFWSHVYLDGEARVDASNNYHLCFGTFISGSVNQVMYLSRSYSGDWTSASTVWGSQATYPSLAIDTSNIRHMAFRTNAAVMYLSSLSSNVQVVTSAEAPIWGFDTPSINVDSSGNRSIFMRDLSISGAIRRLRFDRSAGWQASEVISPASEHLKYKPISVIDSTNKTHLFWTAFSVNSPFYSTIRYANNLSTWSVIQNLHQSHDNRKIATINSWWPQYNASTWICRPKIGYVIANVDQNDNLKLYNSFDLTWDGGAAQPMAHDLTKFASDVSSDLDDIIQVYTCHEVKKNISSLLIQFIDADSNTATAELCALSSWKSCSNDQWGLTHNIPKRAFTLSIGSFQWGSCNTQIQMHALSSLNVSTQVVAKCAIDNLRMVKTPPIPSYRISAPAMTNLLFFGSAATAALRPAIEAPPQYIPQYTARQGAMLGGIVVTFPMVPNPLYQDYLDGKWSAPAPQLDAMGELQLEGLKMVGDPLPSGTYYYKTTFVKESPLGMEIESTPSFQSSGYMVSNAASSWTYIGLTNIPIAPDSMNVVGRKIYRRRSDETTYRACYTIADNAVTTFLDTIPNTALGKGLEDDHTPPPNAKYVLKGSGQLVYYLNIYEQGVAYPSRMRYSLPYEPYYCPINNSVDFSADDGQEITGGFEFNGVIHVLKNRSTFSFGKGAPQTLHSTIGCIAPYSVAIGRNEVFWLSEDGIIKYRMYQFENVSHSINKQSIYRVQTILNRLPKDQLGNARGIYYNGLYLLAVTDVGSITNNLVLCYDVDNDLWSVFPDVNVNCWATWLGGQEGYRLFFGNNSGLICEMFTGDYDISTPIYSKIRCKDFGIPTPEEQPRKAFLFLQDLDGHEKTINVTPVYDFVSNSGYEGGYQLSGLTSGQHTLQKIDLPMHDPCSFFSMQVEASGRIKISQLEIYAKQEKVR